MSSEQVQELIDQIASDAWLDAELVDPTVREVVVVRHQVGWNARTAALLIGEADVYESYPVFVADELFDELRDITATAEGGAWFTFRLRISVQEGMSVEYDYDNPPDFISMNLFPEDVEVELTNWPRAAERTPEWLRAASTGFA